ncbi:hypothetical protein [Nocardia testacea]|uniref:hypothetical protein n=1 Tax=Nocardia testacea TaxID=248551 RepID=UPI000585149E|nr:hypothetical protein [Nocardia testacea]
MGEPPVTRPGRTAAAPGQHRVPASGPRLHYDAIRSKAAHLGLTAKELDTALGVRLGTLEEDPDQRGVSLIVLDRLRRLLDMPLDDLVIYGGPADIRPPPGSGCGEAEDAGCVLALLVIHDGLGIADFLARSGWSRRRLDQALTVLGHQLEATALRVVATDDRLTVLIRTAVLPDDLRTAFTDQRMRRIPMGPHEAVELVKLVRNKVLEPFPDSLGLHEESTNAYTVDPSGMLARQRIAIHRTSPTLQRSTAANTLEIHPDVMFALGLADRPAPTQPPPRPNS